MIAPRKKMELRHFWLFKLRKINPNVEGKNAYFSDEKEVEEMFNDAVKKFKTIHRFC